MKEKVLKTIRNIFDGAMIFLLLLTTTAYALPSDGVTYDGSTSGSSATNVNDALNDLYSKLNDKQNEINNINNIGNAGANHILSGYTAYVKGKTVTGTIPSKGATTYTPGTNDQTIGVGNYLSGIQTIKGDANLIAANIAKGKSIFGVAGTCTGSFGNLPTAPVTFTSTFGINRYYYVRTYGHDIKVEVSGGWNVYWHAYFPKNNWDNNNIIFHEVATTNYLTRDSTTGIITDSGKYEYIVIYFAVNGTQEKTMTLTWV